MLRMILRLGCYNCSLLSEGEVRGVVLELELGLQLQVGGWLFSLSDTVILDTHISTGKVSRKTGLLDVRTPGHWA